MYKCNNCDETFEEPEWKRTCFEQEYGVANLWNSRTYYKKPICPCCGDDEIEEEENEYN